MEDYETITSCRICGNTDLKTVFDLKDHSLSGRFPGPKEEDPSKAPLVLVRCDDEKNSDACGLLQLKHRVNPDELYQHDYGYYSGITQTMVDHLQGIVDQIIKRNILEKGDIVLDIGSNDATMLKMYSNDYKRVGIDPTGEQFKEYYTEGLRLLGDYFTKTNYDKILDNKAKVITSIAMFYDLPDPTGFMRDIKECLHENGIWVFEQSYMPSMIETKSMDTICHEHLEYYSLKAIQYMMNKVGMKIIDLEFNNSNGGSFRVTATHKNNPIEQKIDIDKILLKEKNVFKLNTSATYEEFMKNSETVKKEITKFLTEEKKKGKSIYIYGASTKGNTLLQYCGIGKDLITAAAERNPEKYGRRTPGTNIPIISEKEARAAKPDYFIVLPWHFKNEIIKREKDYLLSGGKLIFPLPTFEIISKEDIASQDDN